MTMTNETRRHVMAIAWGFYGQAVEDGDRRYTFAQALASAWRFSKRPIGAAPQAMAEQRAVARCARQPEALRASASKRRSLADQASAMGV